MSYVVDLEEFHGPLDLLLYLIEKNEIDIYDIPIAVIADQYIEYLNRTGDFNLDRMGDFLVMASYLLNIKSRMLLPRPPQLAEDEEDTQTDPRDELVKKLLDYKKYKEAAGIFKEMEAGSLPRVYYRPATPGQVSEQLVADTRSLVRAYRDILRRLTLEHPSYEVPAGDVNVGDKIEEILHALQDAGQEGICFQDLFAEAGSRREVLALFLALLELIRMQKALAVQESLFANIYVYMRVD